MSLTALQEQRGRLVTQAREALDEIKANTDESRAAELETRHDAIMAEFDKVEANIAREQRLAAAEARAEEIRAANRPNMEGEARGSEEPAKPEYREAFIELARNGFDVQAISAEARAVIKAGVAEFRSQSTSATAGGYTVPTDLATAIDKTLKMWGPMYDEDICTVLTTASGNAIDFPTVDDTAVAVAKHTEGAAMTDDGGVDATFGKMTLNAYAFDTEWVQVSMELLQDSAVNIEAFIGELLGERLARRVNTELTTGDGNGDPNGIVTASTQGKESASGTAITADELIDLLHSVDPAYRMSPKARFMFNDSTLAAIRKLKDGQNNYLWQMGDVRTGAPGTLLGQAYSVNQAMDSIGVGKKVVLFGDFSKYYVRKVGAPVVGVRREYYWPDIGLAGIVRLDGDLIQTGAVKHLLCNDGV
ncbi:phage major capsid protein [Novosphingobium sp. NPDC080210]|uniref:phage major capsid protein n=1 Tax=Novosphingobium sp. NPDC080210 TaxID=3390596 RepID=UPI003CFCD097